jgi:hypothetical protein
MDLYEQEGSMARPIVTVNFDPTPSQSPVEPTTVALQTGDGVTWRISGLSAGVHVRFDFNPTGLAPQGLFGSIFPNSKVEVVSNDSGEAELTVDSFFQPDETTSNYPYNIVVNDTSGNILLSIIDPMIDSLGTPSGPVDDEGNS